MTDFKSAFKQGIDAARKAEASRNEINSVFEDLNKQLSEVSAGKLTIERRQLLRPIPSWASALERPKKYWALVAHNPLIGKSPATELCEWDSSKAGYPCKLTWDSEKRYCENKRALEDALSELLRDPIVSEKMTFLITKSSKK